MISSFSSSQRLQSGSRLGPTSAVAPAAAAAAAVGQQHRRVACAAKQQRRRPEQPLLKEDFEVPAVGWMWEEGTAAATKTSLKSANIKAKKSLGQNFCTDDNILSDIVTAARVTPSDVVIEVGPGTGNLTRHLLATRARVLAVEKDDTLVERLREEFKQVPNLQLVHGDVMRLDLQALIAQMAAAAAAGQQDSSSSSQPSSSDPQQQQQQLQQAFQEALEQPAAAGGSSNSSSRSSSATAPARQRRRGVKVVANLPYNITKEFLQAMLPQGGVVSELSIMIQEEVAQRLVDPTPARPDYRAMSVITHYYSTPVYRFLIPKEKYFPVPGVDGALVTFKLLPPSKRVQVQGERGFITLINKAFSERRKMMRNTLQPLYTSQQVEAALTKAGVRPDALFSSAHAAAISGTSCAPVPNFFPPGKEDSSVPPAWTQTAQTAAGNLESNQLYTVVLTSNRNVPEIDVLGPPVLYMLPKHDLLTVGATPSCTCMGYGATAAVRHLLSSSSSAEAAADTAGEGGDDAAAAAGRRLAQAGAVVTPARYRVEISIGKAYSKNLGEFRNAIAPAAITLDMFSNFTDGYYCMNLKVTIVAFSGLVGKVAVPVTDLHSTTQVCFYKLDAMPNATVTFNTCGETFSANITASQNITPVPLFPGSSELLFMPVYRFESDLNRTVDGSWPAGGAPTKMEEWVVVGTAAAALKPVTYLPEGQYPNGFYNIRVESSLATEYPSLLSLGVASGYDKYNEDTAPEALVGLYKVLPNKQWPSGKVLGIQNELTAFISLDGPELDAIPVNAEISFNWKFDGFGKQYCWIDGLRYYNDAEFMCRQPLDLTLPNSKNHTLTILLVDVCSKNYTVEMTYSTWGYAITKAPKSTVAAIDSDSLTGGQTFEIVGTGLAVGSTTTRTRSPAGTASSGSLLMVPLLLAVLHAGRQAGAV